MRFRGGLAIFVAALALVPATASAAIRYTSPTGSGSACSQAAPCSFTTGVTGAADGDTVQLTADEYGLFGQRVDVNANNLTIQGPGPVGNQSTFIPYLMFGDDPGGATLGYRLVFFGTNPKLRNLGITGHAGSSLVNANSGSHLTADRVVIDYTDPDGGPAAGGIALAGDSVTITNSVIRNEGGLSSGKALEASGSITGSLVYARNGTAISIDGAFHDAGRCTLTARNTIAWGSGRNIRMEGPGGGPCTTVTFNYDYSWIPLSAGPQTGGGYLPLGSTVLQPGPSNLPDTPTAVDPANPGATILPASSPAINAGCTVGCGTYDYYGRPRPIGSANDIGPYEATLLPEIPTGSVGAVTATTARLNASINPNGGSTSYSFQIRRVGAGSWDTVTTGSLAEASNTPSPVTTEANLLQPATAYEARVTALNSAGEAVFPAFSFSTSPNPDPAATVKVSSLKARLSRRSAYLTSRAAVSAAGSVVQAATTGSGKKTKTWCRTSTTARGAGSYPLKCNLGSKGRRYLKKRSLVLTVKTTLKSPTGTAVTSTRKLTIKRKR